MPRKPVSKAVSASELAQILGVSLSTITAWVRRGCPFLERGAVGKQWQFDSADVVKWLREQDVERALGKNASVTMEEARTRDKLATAQLKEIELARQRGQVVNVDDVKEIVCEDYAVVRSRILAIPGRLAQTCAIEADAEAVQRLIMAEVRDALSELSYEGISRGDSGNAR